ncbi:DUF4232 domain-containing protein, partial [Streptomyces sp. adm13(2018)]|uniref:DUF4232 domain-containing protein n=1 Tax=Streptomyces sp. adm13(2018) TaxID=2479007 RepID=UPI0021C56FE0
MAPAVDPAEEPFVPPSEEPPDVPPEVPPAVVEAPADPEPLFAAVWSAVPPASPAPCPASPVPCPAAPACAYTDVKITAAKADEVPTEHIVLTATNTSGSACTLLQYPLIAFGPIQTAKDVPAVAKSRPAAPVVLRP